MATPRKTPRPVPASHTGRAITGVATFYCGNGSPCTRGYGPDCYCAAAGPKLRFAMGAAWRGRTVRVTANGASVAVKLIDVCICGSVLDLYGIAFGGLAPLSRGVLDVSVSW